MGFCTLARRKEMNQAIADRLLAQKVLAALKSNDGKAFASFPKPLPLSVLRSPLLLASLCKLPKDLLDPFVGNHIYRLPHTTLHTAVLLTPSAFRDSAEKYCKTGAKKKHAAYKALETRRRKGTAKPARKTPDKAPGNRRGVRNLIRRENEAWQIKTYL